MFLAVTVVVGEIGDAVCPWKGDSQQGLFLLEIREWK